MKKIENLFQNATPTIEIKDNNVMKPFYEIPIRNKEETYKAITELVRNGDFTT